MIFQHVLLGVFWIAYCTLHSFFASTGLKKKLRTGWQTHFQYYRLYYSVFAAVSFIAILYYQIHIPSLVAYIPSTVMYIFGGSITVAGLVIMGICIRKYFLQLSGLRTLFIDEYKTGNTLIITGIHRYVRHPLYSGTFVFIWGLFLVLPYFSLCIANSIITIYTLIGIRFEEDKLVAEFGDDYKIYQRQVPKIIPAIKGIKSNHPPSTAK